MAEDWLKLLKGVRSARRTLAPGDFLFRAGEQVQALFHVEQGNIRLTQAGATLHVAEAGQPFAEASLFAEFHDCDAVAETASQVLAFPKGAVLLLLKAHPALNLAFSAYLARQLQRLRGRFELMRLKNARERVLTYLTQAGAMNHAVSLDRPLTMVASEIGLTREALYRTLTKLEKEGQVRRDGTRTFSLTRTD
ncbi:MAG: Crp/Fnr family transcriptional regulator [Rhodospirillaceae bacterium]|nr:Crp/Fnr family transcriptional regulator [Rhodospirillales bacterium]